LMVEPISELGKVHEAEGGVFVGGDHFEGDEGGGFVGWDAAVLLEPLFLIDALGFEAAEEIGSGFVAASFGVDALDEALGDGFLDGDGVQAPGAGEGVRVRGTLNVELGTLNFERTALCNVMRDA